MNQFANYAQLYTFMGPFYPFFSPHRQFERTPELDAALKSSKESIIEAISKRVIFDHERPRCLHTDWSKQEIGYCLLQKYCACSSIRLNCCANGCHVTLAGSRFLFSTEQSYVPIEGKVLVIAWSLEKTKFFTKRFHHLTVAADHKPLTRLIDSRILDEIANTKLFRLKQRTLPYSFHIIYLSGKINLAADAASHHPLGNVNELTKGDTKESFIAAAIPRDSESMSSVTWDRLASKTAKDFGMQALTEVIHSGCPDDCTLNDTALTYWRYPYSLYEIDSVVIYDDCVVLSPALRDTTLAALHLAHQDVSLMGAPA